MVFESTHRSPARRELAAIKRVVFGAALIAGACGRAHGPEAGPSIPPSASASPARADHAPPDVLLTHARVVRAAGGHATAIAIAGGKIVAVGGDELAATKGPSTVVRDLGGAAVLPGLRDAHIHLKAFGDKLLGRSCDLTEATSLADLTRRVKEWIRAKRLAAGAWVRCEGWNETKWGGLGAGALPTSTAPLDAVAAENPVVLVRQDGHTVWVNKRALEIAGITRATPAVRGGEIFHCVDGEPTGVLADNAGALVAKHMPRDTEAQIEESVLRAADACRGNGLVEVHDANVTPPVEQTLRRLAESGRLPIRVYAMVHVENPDELEARLRREPPVKTPIGGRLAIRAVKLFADGTFGNEGAHVLAPYADHPRHVGTTRLGRAEIESVARVALQRGYQVATHAIGDAAVHDTLAAYQAALAGRTDARFRIEHAGLVDEADMPRFGALGVVAVTHGWLASHRNAEELGSARAAHLWDLPALAKVTRIALGSDFPTGVSPKPLDGFRVAFSRGLPAADALRAYTEGPAYAAFEESERGAMEPGMDADLTILSDDPVSLAASAPDRIGMIQVVSSYLAGAPPK